MCLWCCWKDLDEPGFNGIYLVRFGFRMWEILESKFQKTRFWKEKSVEDVVTLECHLPFDSSRRNCDVPLVLLERS